MSVISLRLPDDLEAKLEEEARLTSRPRSELAREAIADYLARAERERFLASLEGAARGLALDAAAVAEARAVADDFLPLDNEALALGEPRAPYRATPIAKGRKRSGR